jgi:hypothetical protein
MILKLVKRQGRIEELNVLRLLTVFRFDYKSLKIENLILIKMGIILSAFEISFKTFS